MTAHQPFIKWYPTDWRADPRLRMCSLAARGLWIELIGYMHEGEPYGHLTINGATPSIEDIAALVGRPLAEVRKAMAELDQRQVYSVDALQGTPYSRRMVRDKAKAEQDRRNGKGGGNPKLKAEVKEGVNPPDKAHIPEARSQKPEPEISEPDGSGAEAPPDPSEPERQFFKRGKEVLGKSSGGQLAKLLKAAGGNVALARSKIELAATKDNAHEFIAKVITTAGTGAPARPLTQHQIERENSRRILDDLNKFATGGGQSQPDLGLLRHDPGDGPEGVHGGVGRVVIDLSATRPRQGG